MNILFIVPSLYGGGAERVCARLSNVLCERHRVTVLCTWPDGNRNGIYPLDQRVRVVEFREEVPESRFGRFLFRYSAGRAFLWMNRIRKLKRQLNIQTCVSFLTSCNYDNVMSRAGERVIVSIRSMLEPTIPENPEAAERERRRIRAAAKKADLIVSVAEQCGREQAERFGASGRKLVTIYNPVNPEELRRLAEEEPAAQGQAAQQPSMQQPSTQGQAAQQPSMQQPFAQGQAAQQPVETEPESADAGFAAFRAAHGTLLCTAGRLTAQKGQESLIRALAEVRKEFPGCGLVILGKGELEQSLRQTAEELGLSGHVLFAGFQDNPFRFMGKSDIFVLPSRFEGFSNALLEAMALGLPLVACDCDSGPRELLAPETDCGQKAEKVEEAPYGILVPDAAEDREKFLAEGILRLLRDPDLMEHYRQQDRVRIEAFRTEKILSRWENVITGRQS